MSEDELLGDITSSKPVRKGEKTKTNFSNARIENIRKDLMNQGIIFLNQK